MTLTRRRVSPKVRSMKVGVPDAMVVPGGEAQVGGQALAVGEQDLETVLMVLADSRSASRPHPAAGAVAGTRPCFVDHGGSRSQIRIEATSTVPW